MINRFSEKLDQSTYLSFPKKAALINSMRLSLQISVLGISLMGAGCGTENDLTLNDPNVPGYSEDPICTTEECNNEDLNMNEDVDPPTALPDLEVTASTDLAFANPGSTVEQTAFYANNGTGEATGTQLEIDYDETLLHSIVPTAGGVDDGDKITFDLGALAEDDEGIAGFTAKVTDTAAHGATITTNYAITANEADEFAGDNVTTETNNVLRKETFFADFTDGNNFADHALGNAAPLVVSGATFGPQGLTVETAEFKHIKFDAENNVPNKGTIEIVVNKDEFLASTNGYILYAKDKNGVDIDIHKNPGGHLIFSLNGGSTYSGITSTDLGTLSGLNEEIRITAKYPELTIEITNADGTGTPVSTSLTSGTAPTYDFGIGSELFIGSKNNGEKDNFDEISQYPGHIKSITIK